jgi:heme exporter protein D
MNWSSWSAFLHMGGYGFYVWSSFGAALLAIVCELVQLSHRRRLAYLDHDGIGEARHETKK